MCAALQLFRIKGFYHKRSSRFTFQKSSIFSFLLSFLSPVLHPQFLHTVGHLFVFLVHLPGQLFVNFCILFDNLRNRLQRGVRFRLRLGSSLASVAAGADLDGVIVPIDIHHPIAVQPILDTDPGRRLFIACGRLSRARGLRTSFRVLIRFSTGGISIEILTIPVMWLLSAALMLLHCMAMGRMILLMVMRMVVMVHRLIACRLELELWFRRLTRANPTTANDWRGRY